MSEKTINRLIIAYALIAIFTFGHSFNQIESEFATQKGSGAIVASIFWPLYWSVQAWK